MTTPDSTPRRNEVEQPVTNDAEEKVIRLSWHCMCFVGPCKWQGLNDYEPDECDTTFEEESTQELWDAKLSGATCPRCKCELTQQFDYAEIIP